MKANTETIFLNGATIRMHNKRIQIREKGDKTIILFHFADENADTPACQHRCHRGKVRETFVKMTTESMELLVKAYIDYRNYKESKS